jgi:prevent-host-death family protein
VPGLHDHTSHMIVTTIATLKASLSELLAGVKAGEEVLVTDRGRPVARIVPYESGGDEIDSLARTGHVRRPRAILPEGFWERPRPADPKGRLLAALLEERESAR